MEKLQEVVRALRRAGGIVNDSCGMHVHVDASKHTPQSLKNVLSIMYSNTQSLLSVRKWSMCSVLSKSSCVFARRDTEGSKSNGPNAI